MTDYKIPFDKKGNQLSYEAWDTHIMEENYIFDDTLEFVSYGRGRSSVTFEWIRTNGTTVSMFVSDMSDAVQYSVRGKLKGRFTFVKNGQNYGCKLMEAAKT